MNLDELQRLLVVGLKQRQKRHVVITKSSRGHHNCVTKTSRDYHKVVTWLSQRRHVTIKKSSRGHHKDVTLRYANLLTLCLLQASFWGQRPRVTLLLLGPPSFPIILFGSTTLLTWMTGISLHMQWPLTSSNKQLFVFQFASNSAMRT
jgi:hypothetical protein